MGVAVSTSSSSQQNDAGGDAGAGAGQQQDSQQQSAQQANQGQGNESGNADKGFPENTPVAEMTHEQRAAYYKHQNRQTDNKLAAFKGVTPEQVAQLQQENETLKNDKLSADEKALKEATQKAGDDARAAADAQWRPKYLASELKGVAAGVIKDQEQLASFLAMTDATKFAREDGELDHEKVMGHLTALFGGGGQGQQSGNGQQQRSWGQHSGGTSGGPHKPGEAGRAAAQQRHGIKTQ